ncbi:MAG: hypothetical protein A2901_01670 [Elusimicrobia bacterium RIFCSPLOWO2_01_FULL_54_10]|nr:MAG: hypothetical protein A2901_01670 [Elusimicrobia bacterium RIFCSPLOWO2_01_FULL_54_10]
MILADPNKEYFSIGEASEITRVPPYVMRYWESEFRLLRPSRRESGQRRYSRSDLETILKIKDLLYVKRFTIPGAKKFLNDEKRTGGEQVKLELADSSAASDVLKETKQVLEEILSVLK